MMNVTGFANFFHQNSIFQQNRPLGQKLVQPSAGDALNRLSENLLNERRQTKNLNARFDTLELSAEAAEGRKDSSLEEMPEGLLRFYLNQCKVGATLSERQEASLTEYRDRLSAFDRTIQAYQDMLDGKTALPEQMKREDAALLLEITKSAREQFLRQGAEKLNRVSDSNPTQTGYMGKAYGVAAERAGNSRSAVRWRIDASAGGVYDEIDRALASAHHITATFQKGASGILCELKRRGCVKEGEGTGLERQAAADSAAAGREPLLRSVYHEIWAVLKRSVGGNAE